MNVSSLSAWLYALMLWIHPPAQAVARPAGPWAQETEEARGARYRAIADAVADVAADPQEPPVYAGPEGRARTAALLLAVSYAESGWRRDVDLGLGARARGGGLDSCLTQIRVGAGRTREGWSSLDLTSDRRKCFRASLHLLRASYGVCRGLPPSQRLSAYASGRCDSEAGQRLSEARIAIARRLLAHSPAAEASGLAAR